MNVLWPNGSTTPPQLNSPYGPRESFWTPDGWTNPFHYGQDCTGFSMNRSIADGVVVYVGYNGGYGNHVRVKNDDGYSHSHSHGAPGGFRVSVGQRVRAGDDLMVQGTTGRSTGVHDHLEVYLPNGDTTDPVRYIRDRLSGAASTGTTNQSEEDENMPINIRRESTGVSYTLVPGYGITAHTNEHGARLTTYVNTGKWFPAGASPSQREEFGERQLNDDNLRWELGLMDLGWVSQDLDARLPKPGEYRYCEKLQKIHDAAAGIGG